MRTGVEPFAAAVYAAITAPKGLRALSTKPRVRAALRVLVGELAAAGLVPGRVRWLLARIVLIAIAAAAYYGLTQPDRRPVERIGYAGLLLLAAAGWLVRRRTVAGHRVLRALRRQYAHLLWPPAATRLVPAEPGAVTAYALNGGPFPGLDGAHDPRPFWRGNGGWSDADLGGDGGSDPP